MFTRFSSMSAQAILKLILAAVMTAVLVGCAVEESDGVSNLPWNRPQRWEGQGMMGPMMQNQ
jgi:type IV pilus biogenesis protein CpaD/CtpE